MFILLPFIAILVLCFYQDVRYRGIHWFVFPLVLAGALALNWNELNLIALAYNIGFVAFLLLGLTLYLSLKERKLVNITNGYFALGDILFLLALTPLFSIQWFVIFFTFGTIATLIFHLIASMIKPQKTIPYAGYMAAVCIGYLAFHDQLHQLIPTYTWQ
ncbi:MAG: hypothetical protein AB8B56_15580 [Crocinitomicaceae bacterium]